MPMDAEEIVCRMHQLADQIHLIIELRSAGAITGEIYFRWLDTNLAVYLQLIEQIKRG